MERCDLRVAQVREGFSSADHLSRGLWDGVFPVSLSQACEPLGTVGGWVGVECADPFYISGFDSD